VLGLSQKSGISKSPIDQGVERDLVLVGGGHTHALVIKKFGMRPIPNTRVTLISEKSLTPYSGMLPGFVAGHYTYLDAHVDLHKLCRWSNVRFIEGWVNGIDLQKQQVRINSQTPIEYDQLSIDIGSTPDTSVPGAKEHAVGVKPVSHFGHVWDELLQNADGTAGNWGIVGAGAGGVELVLAMAHRLQATPEIKFHLIFSGQQILKGYPAKARASVERALEKHNVTLHPGFRVGSVDANGLNSVNGLRLDLTKSIWCTGAAAAPWLADTGLEVSDRGFISVNEYLQSVSHTNVYAAGDCADMLFDPRPKAGVYAVRQAEFLADNLRVAMCAPINESKFKAVNLQTDFLSLLSLGDKHAVGCRNGITLSGRTVWALKDRIDQKFMRKLNDPGPKMPMASADMQVMHCAGCGSKLGPDLIADSLNALQIHPRPEVVPALGRAEDASLWQVPDGKLCVQSIDGFRSFTDNLSRLGTICVNHALSDLYAMGAEPVSAQVWVNLAHAHPRIHKRDHALLMSAIVSALNEQEVTLAGGHSSEGVETHVALVANGVVAKADIWHKNTVNPGDVLILTKPIGTGVILAADMQAAAPAHAVHDAYQCMLESNRQVALLLGEFSPTAVTDVTGFGLIGHTLEMLSADNIGARLSIESIPFLDGAKALAQAGFESSLVPQLQPYLNRCRVDQSIDPFVLQLLLDPQTSGGLLISMNSSGAQNFIDTYPQACAIGEIVELEGASRETLELSV